MTGLYLSLISCLSSLIVVIMLITQHYQARVDAAREDAARWKRKAEQLDKPGA